VSLLQYLASQTAKLEQLELLLNHGLDPRAVTEDVDYTPLEIAACKENTKAFDLLAPHYEESIKKKIAQLFIWGLTDKAPSAAFMLLFESVPLAEVNNCTIFESNLLQALAYEGKTPHVAFLLEQGVDPEVCKETSKRPMHLAWLNDHVGTMTELAKYGVEPDSEVRGSSDWQFVEKEQERRWQKEMLSLMQKQQKEMENQTKLLKLIAKASGAEVEED